MIIEVKHSQGSYDIVLQRGSLLKVDELICLNRKVLVVTDSGVPKEYAEIVKNAAKQGYIVSIEQGERSKNIDNLKMLLTALTQNGFTRTDCVVAVGGGVVGDLSGFAASVFMRGIDFYNIPTTLLSQVDSSIGGKTAIDFMGLKNIVGSFYPPKKVIIDPDTLKTLSKRHITNGLCEALKMAATSDSELFDIFLNGNIEEEIDTIIERSLKIKKYVVENDEKESGLRKVLNFGHTVAHAIESAYEMEGLYHGECVGIGMLYMSEGEAREKIEIALKKINSPTEFKADLKTIIEACSHDKKMSGDEITIVYVKEIGSFEFKKIKFSKLKEFLKGR